MPDPRLTAIRALLAEHPEITGSDVEVSNQLNALTEPYASPRVSLVALSEWAFDQELISPLCTAKRGSTVAADRADAVLQVLLRPEGRTIARAAAARIIDSLQAAGICSAAQAAAGKAIGSSWAPTVDVRGIGSVSPDDVARATRGWVEV